MPQAQIVASWVANGFACMAVRVGEGPPGGTEYVGRVPMDDAWRALSGAQKKAALVEACKQVRDASLTSPIEDLGISGAVAI